MVKYFLFALLLTVAANNSAMSETYSYPDPKCQKCKPDEYLTLIETVVHGITGSSGISNPPCGSIAPLVNAAGSDIKSIAEQLPKAAVGYTLEIMDKHAGGGDFGRVWKGLRGDYAACTPVCATIPEGGTFTANRIQIRYLPERGGHMETCPANNTECGGFARIEEPIISGRTMCINIANWSNQTRRVNYFFWYTSPVPPIESR